MRNPASSLPWEASFCIGAAATAASVAEPEPAAAEDLLLTVLDCRGGIHEQFRFLCATKGGLK
jgi:hypothetical protein